MSISRRTLPWLVAVAGAALITLAVSAVALSGGGDPRKEVKLDAASAKAIADQFAGDKVKGAKVQGPINGALHRAYLVAGPGADVWVDAFDGTVVQAVVTDVVASNGEAMAATAATERARGFLRDHKIPAPQDDPAVELVDRGVFSTWVITWQGRSGKALAPDLREVELMADTGDVLRVVHHVRPYAQPPEAVVTADQAVSLAIAAAGMPDASAEQTNLRIVFDDDGRQMLTWDVVLTRQRGDGVGEAAFVDVNAITGDALVTGRG
jgi:hypothetical protein